MTDGRALVLFKRREELRDLVVEVQKPLPHRQHNGRRGKLLGDRRKLKDRVLGDRQRVVRISKTDRAGTYDLALFRIQPGTVEAVPFICFTGELFHHSFLIHSFAFLYSYSFLHVIPSITRQLSPNSIFAKPPFLPKVFFPIG